MADDNGKVIIPATVEVKVDKAKEQIKILKDSLKNLTKESGISGIKILDEKSLASSFKTLAQFKKELLNIPKESSLNNEIQKTIKEINNLEKLNKIIKKNAKDATNDDVNNLINKISNKKSNSNNIVKKEESKKQNIVKKEEVANTQDIVKKEEAVVENTQKIVPTTLQRQQEKVNKQIADFKTKYGDLDKINKLSIDSFSFTKAGEINKNSINKIEAEIKKEFNAKTEIEKLKKSTEKVEKEIEKSFQTAKDIIHKTYGNIAKIIKFEQSDFKYTPTGKLSSTNDYLKIVNDKIIGSKEKTWINTEEIQKRQLEKAKQIEQQRIENEKQKIISEYTNSSQGQGQPQPKYWIKKYWIDEEAQKERRITKYREQANKEKAIRDAKGIENQSKIDKAQEEVISKRQPQQKPLGYFINPDYYTRVAEQLEKQKSINQANIAERNRADYIQRRNAKRIEQTQKQIENQQEKQYQIELSQMKSSAAGITKAFDKRIFEPIRNGNNTLQAKEIGGAVSEVEKLVNERLKLINKDLQLAGQGLNVTSVKQNTRHGVTSITQVITDVEGKITGKIVHDIQKLGDNFVIRPGTGSFIPEITAKQKALQRYQQKLGQQSGNLFQGGISESQISRIVANSRQFGLTDISNEQLAALRNGLGIRHLGNPNDPSLQYGAIQTRMTDYYTEMARNRGMQPRDVQVSTERRVDNSSGNAFWQTTTNVRTGRDTYIQYRDAIDESTGALHRQGVVVRNETNRNRGMWEQIKSALVAVPAWYVSMTMFYGTMRKLTEGVGVVNEINKAMTEVAIVTQSSTKAVSQLKNEFVQMANDMKVPIQEVLNISADLYRQGLNTNDVKERMKSIIEYSKISSLDLKTSTEIITAALNTTGSSANHLIDVMSYLGKILPLCMVTYICKVSYIGGKLEAVNPEERLILR